MSNPKTSPAKSATAGKATKEVVDETKDQPVKVSRRGIGSARGTQRLKFSNEIVSPNGLFLGHLASVEVSTITIGEDKTGLPSFNGLDVPRLTLTFNSNDADVNKRRFITLAFTAVESNTETIPGGKEEWKVNQVFDWIKHVLNVYVLKGRDLTEDEEAMLSLSYEDFDEEGSYVPVEPEEVVASWKTLFENFANIMNNVEEAQPAFKTKDGKIISVWLKLVRFVKNRKSNAWAPVNNGELSFPTFVGEGAIEIYKAQQMPSIRLNAVNETIAIMQVDKPKAPNMTGGAMMGGPVGGVQMPQDPMMANNFNAGFDTTASAAGDDMPF